jgi:uncharacterized protein YegL
LKKGYTEIVMVLDRSGSMSSIRNSTIEGVNEFLSGQKKLDGKCKFTLWQFDTEHETPYKAISIHKMPYLTTESFVPRGATALNDAICMAAEKTGNRLRRMKEHNRPENVMFVIMTDGHENASREFDERDVKKMIKHQSKKYNWDFVFLGANQDAIETASDYGIDFGKAMTFAANKQGVDATFKSLNSYYSNVRSGTVMASAANFTAQDRQEQEEAGA